MKNKILILLGILSFMIIPRNVYAYELCGNSVNIDNSNYIYILYNQYSNDLNNYNYFIIGRDRQDRFILDFFNSNDFYVYIKNNNFAFYSNSWSTYKHCTYSLGSDSINCSNKSNGGYTYASNDYVDYVFYNVSDVRTELGNYISKSDFISNIENVLSCPNNFTITYYLNNEIYNTFTVNNGSSHTLLYYEPSFEYEFSGWSYDNNIDLTNITSNVNIYGTTTLKPYYTISYYINNNLYDSESVIKGTNYVINNYVPPRHYEFSGWSYDNNIDLTNITSNVDIYGTSTYIPPNIEITDNFNSPIHELTLKIIGEGVPKEFDFIYMISDFLILLILVFTLLAPFIIVFKLFGVI